jgi:hypothetical protein
MNINFEDNEFTFCELLKYLKEAYGLQINVSPFVAYTINNWIRNGKIPTAYGDHKILKAENIAQSSNAKVLTLEVLPRDTLEHNREFDLNYYFAGNFIKAHGAEIKVETKESEGTEFVVELPLK